MRLPAHITTGLTAASLCLLGACASSPVHYYTLVPPATHEETVRTPAPFVIDVLPVGIPAGLDQQQMVVRTDTSSLQVLDDERWNAPLGDELRSALSAALSRRLGTQDVAGLPRPANRKVLGIRVQIRQFDARPARDAQLVADWSLGATPSGGSTRVTCHTQLQVAAPGSYPELVQAQQRLVGELADEIARAANDAGMRSQYGCPD
ncbi:PqiC family protein [Paraburkholderia ferrariae]|jgi:uncharacterized lipoprotein YmbA|uniref:PqiC family protein n=1 Tax=Paraburkholderia ferrariae TaxID=386056 RepID=UPI000484691C|nr:PqiC family protein [Paraburkholderia ferrariae]